MNRTLLALISATAFVSLATSYVRADPMEGNDLASVSTEELRFDRSPKPDTPLPVKPDLATTKNVDTGKSFWDWSSATDDWKGLRPNLDDHGLTFQANITYDGTGVLTGGVRQHILANRMLLNANITMDTDRLAGWKGGTFFTNFQYQCGRNGSADAGAFQSPSNIDSRSLTQLSELWYEQKLIDSKLRIKAGKLDLSTEFASNPHGSDFLNASMGFSPTIVDFATYPDPATGLLVSIEPDPHFYFRGGVYDGAAQEGIHTGARGPATLFGPPADLFMIGEGGLNWGVDDKLPTGHLALGWWDQTGTFNKFQGGTQSGTNGFYVVLNQTLWTPANAEKDDNRNLAGFVQYGYADASVSVISEHIGAGVAWTGPVHGRDTDVLGLGGTWAQFAGNSAAGFDRGGEFIAEAFYKIQLTAFTSIKPDVQYIHNPGGIAAQHDAVVAGVRCLINF